MCGIVGIYNHSLDKPISQAEINQLMALVKHRGPDDHGVHINDKLALAHTRLAIIDKDTGQQPMHADNGDITIVFNGEIYNYIEIRKELMALGYSFRTQSDTEVIIAAYIQWGQQCVNRFNGMWAFAIYDIRQSPILFCSRDRMGIKPFYFLNNAGRFVFSSEIKGFKALNGFSFRIDKHVLWDHFVFGPKNGGKTYVEDVYELEPGTNLILENGKIRQNSFFQLSDTYQGQSRRFDTQEIDDLLNSAINLRLRSDVSLASINSGGLDSSIISSISKSSISTLKTYCIAPENNEEDIVTRINDESEFASILATHIDSDHNTVRYSTENFFECLDSSISANDGELYHSNSVLMNILFKNIKADGTTVVLGGEGADEVFRGYFSNRIMNLTKFLGNSLGTKVVQQKYKYLKGLPYISRDIQRVIPFIRSNYLSPLLANKVLGIKGEIHKERLEILRQMEDLKPENALTFYEQKFYLAGLLRRADRMSMRNGVELRVPFLDHTLVEHMNAISFASKCGILQRSEKRILKKIGRQYVPPTILSRPKLGFGSPLANYTDRLNKRLEGTPWFQSTSISPRDLWVLNSMLNLEDIAD